MKWIDLFQFLNQKANDIKNLGTFDWQKQVTVYDDHFGGLYDAELIEFFDKNGDTETHIRIDSEGK